MTISRGRRIHSLVSNTKRLSVWFINRKCLFAFGVNLQTNLQIVNLEICQTSNFGIWFNVLLLGQVKFFHKKYSMI